MTEQHKDSLNPDTLDILPDHKIKFPYEANLEPHKFLFNAGHTGRLYRLGIIDSSDTENLYLVERNGKIWGAVDFDKITKHEEINNLVELIEEELTQQKTDDDLEYLEGFEAISKTSDIDLDAWVAKVTAAKLRKRISPKINFVIHQAEAARFFLDWIKNENIDVMEIKKYGLALAEVNKILN